MLRSKLISDEALILQFVLTTFWFHAYCTYADSATVEKSSV